MKMDIWKASILRRTIKYLQIIEDMHETNPDWYLKEFRGNEDWELGLTMTLTEAEEWLSEWNSFEEQGEKE